MSPLESNNQTLIIDPSISGIAGNMFIGALMHLGGNPNRIQQIIDWLTDTISYNPIIQYQVHTEQRNQIQGQYFNVDFVLPQQENKTPPSPMPSDTPQGQTITLNQHLHTPTQFAIPNHTGKDLIKLTCDCMSYFNLDNSLQEIGKQAIEKLIRAEAAIHGQTMEKIHLHEAGTPDTIIDIAGSMILLQDLQLSPNNDTIIWGLPVSVGGGTISFSHGTMSVPAPATLQILTESQYPYSGGPIPTELATPTGVALLTALVQKPYRTTVNPPIVPSAVGIGLGSKNLLGVPNMLRLIRGQTIKKLSPSSATPSSTLEHQEPIVILETDVDDTTGEQMGFFIEEVMSQGALDVSVISRLTKKNRPGHAIRVICYTEDQHLLIRLMMNQLSTLGVRVIQCTRHILPRKINQVKVTIDHLDYPVTVKLSYDFQGKLVQVKPEANDVAKLVKKSGKSWREIDALISSKIWKTHQKNLNQN